MHNDSINKSMIIGGVLRRQISRIHCKNQQEELAVQFKIRYNYRTDLIILVYESASECKCTPIKKNFYISKDIVANCFSLFFKFLYLNDEN